MKYALGLLSLAFAVFGGLIYWLNLTAPDVRVIDSCMTTSMNKVYLCHQSPSYTPFSEISKSLVSAVVISEDASFYSHSGFDWFELRLSFIQNLSRGHFFRGGSTITQQLAKNIFLIPDKTLTRKLREAIIAQRLEDFLTKDDILEKYLNVVEFGENIYGIRAAANFYFDKSPSDLNVLESAFLAYLLPNPKTYSKVFFKGTLDEHATKRITRLLRKLSKFKKITADEHRRWLSYLDQFPWEDLEDYPSFETSHSPIREDHAEQEQDTNVDEENGL